MKKIIRPLKRIMRAIVNVFRQTSTYHSYAEAAKYCGRGYAELDLVKSVVWKNEKLRDKLNSTSKTVDHHSMRSILGIALLADAKKLNVLDFGGGGGTHYFLAQALFGDKIDFKWHVVETEAMSKEAAKLETDELKFFNNIDSAAESLGAVDLIFSSGALQYVPDPMYFLDRLLSLNAKHVFLTRIGLSEESNKIMIQSSRLKDNGPGQMSHAIEDRKLRYPATFLEREKLESEIEKHYNIKVIFCEDRNAYVAGRENIHMYGYYAQHKTHVSST